jgi:hypothetical protein
MVSNSQALKCKGGWKKIQIFTRAQLSLGKVPATRCEGPRGFISTLTRQFHVVVDHCDNSSVIQQAQGLGQLVGWAYSIHLFTLGNYVLQNWEEIHSISLYSLFVHMQ